MDQAADQIPEDEFGALRFSSLDRLYQPQKAAATFILERIHGQAVQDFQARARRGRRHRDTLLDAPMGSDRRDFDRPHHAFMIDGERGSGKTTVLLTLQGHLSLMRLSVSRITSADADEQSQIKDLQKLDLTMPAGAVGDEKVALVLPVVFTEEMEQNEATMEAVFALLEGQITQSAREETQPARRQRLLDLITMLRGEVSVAWTFARKIGAEAVANDALDYNDYVDKRAEYNRRAYTRVSTWRRFLDKCLDELGYELLVLLFDDSDLNSAAGEDIIRAMRMYFSHPRVACIMACESVNLELTIFSRNLAEHSKGLQALNILDNHLIGEDGYVPRLGSLEADNSAALLEKIFPPALRCRLKTSDMEHVRHFFPAKPPEEDHFGAWCRERYLACRGSAEREAALAWWLLSGPYRRIIADNIRRIINFRYRTRDPRCRPLDILLDNFRLRELVRGFGRDFSQLKSNIEQEEYNRSWGDDESIIPLDTYELTFVEFWIDLQIANANLLVREMVVIQRWLPRQLGETEQYLNLRDRNRKLGVASMFKSHILPRNCLYVYQFRRISDLVAGDLPPPSPWIAWLEAWAALDEANQDLDALSYTALTLKDMLAGQDARQVLDLLGIQVNRVRNTTEAEIGDDDGLRALVALYAMSRDDAADPPSLIEVLSHVVSHEVTLDLMAFAKRLAKGVISAERRRQEAILSWGCAIALAELGDDNVRLERPAQLRQLPVAVTATTERSRLQALASLTADRLHALEKQDGTGQRGSRHRLLLIWSLIPILRPLYDYGTDYVRDPDSVGAWTRLGELVGAVAGEYAAIEGLDDAPLGDDELSWAYFDMDAADLRSLVRDVLVFSNTFGSVFRPARAAGNVPTRTSWPRRPEERLALLLGTSVTWARVNVGD